jgi:uncharacterized protein DUF3309
LVLHTGDTEVGFGTVDALGERAFPERREMPLILVILLIVVLLGALPTWPYSRGWGYYPSGGLGLVLLILIILLLTRRI